MKKRQGCRGRPRRPIAITPTALSQKVDTTPKKRDKPTRTHHNANTPPHSPPDRRTTITTKNCSCWRAVTCLRADRPRQSWRGHASSPVNINVPGSNETRLRKIVTLSHFTRTEVNGYSTAQTQHQDTQTDEVNGNIITHKPRSTAILI